MLLVIAVTVAVIAIHERYSCWPFWWAERAKRASIHCIVVGPSDIRPPPSSSTLFWVNSGRGYFLLSVDVVVAVAIGVVVVVGCCCCCFIVGLCCCFCCGRCCCVLLSVDFLGVDGCCFVSWLLLFFVVGCFIFLLVAMFSLLVAGCCLFCHSQQRFLVNSRQGCSSLFVDVVVAVAVVVDVAVAIAVDVAVS